MRLVADEVQVLVTERKQTFQPAQVSVLVTLDPSGADVLVRATDVIAGAQARQDCQAFGGTFALGDGAPVVWTCTGWTFTTGGEFTGRATILSGDCSLAGGSSTTSSGPKLNRPGRSRATRQTI